MDKRPIEPFLWALFSAGGVVAAFLIPVHLALFGLAFRQAKASGDGVRNVQRDAHDLLLVYPTARFFLSPVRRRRIISPEPLTDPGVPRMSPRHFALLSLYVPLRPARPLG